MEEVIYKHETNGEFTGIYAQIEDGKLTITEQDMGEFEKEYSRDGEVESFVFFDVANTNRLMRSLHASDDYSPDFDKMCTYKITYPNFQAFSKNNLCKWVTQRLFFVSLHHVCT